MYNAVSATGGLLLPVQRSGNIPFNLFIFFFFGFLLHWYQPNMGGGGLGLPLNDIAWMMVCLVVATVTLWPLRYYQLRVSRAFLWFSSGLLVLIILAICTKPVWRYDAGIIAAGMAGSLVFYLALLQVRLTPAAIRRLLTAILLGVVLECLLSLVQFFHLPMAQWWEFSLLPSVRPYGIFQQINVMASFVATGVAVALWFCFAAPPAQVTRARVADFSAGKGGVFFIIFLLFGLVIQLCQSQIGYLATLVVVVCYCCGYHQNKLRLLFIISALVAGLLLGKVFQLLGSTPDVTHIQSSHIRWAFIINSLRMFMEKPLFGWGVGGFEYSFLHRFGGLETFSMQGVASHPHNEILLWMVQGGVVGLLGVTAIIIGGAILLRRAYRQKQLPVLAIALPVLLHMMTELPIYTSVVHWLILLLVLRCADTPIKGYTMPSPLAWGLRGLIGGAAATLFILLACAYWLEGELTLVEREGRQMELSATNVPTGAILLHDRYFYDVHIGDLLRFNQSRKPELLLNFERWAQNYSKIHPDANVYDARINIARSFSDKQREEHLMRLAHWLFPHDARFQASN